MGSQSGWSLRLCGRPRLDGPRGERARLPKNAFLVALRLILEAPASGLERSDIASFLWPHHGYERRAGNLRTLMKRIRTAETAAGTFPLVDEAGRLRFDATAVDCDLLALRGAAAAGGLDELARAAPLAARPLLEDFDGQPAGGWAWLSEQRARVVGEFARAARRALADSGPSADPSARERLAFALMNLDATDEEACRALMRLAAVRGQRAEAPAIYDRLVEALRRKSLPPPSDETRALLGSLAAERGTAPQPPRRLQPRVSMAPCLVIDARLVPRPFQVLVEDLVVRLWKTKAVRVTTKPPHGAAHGEPSAPVFRMRVSVSGSRAFALSARLDYQPTGEVVWAETLALDSDRYDTVLSSLLDAMLARVERRLADSEGGGASDLACFVLVAKAFRDLERADLGSLRRARRRLLAALGGDRTLAKAYGGVARSYWMEWLLSSGADPSTLEAARQFAERAIAMAPDEFVGHRELGLVSSCLRRPDEALASLDHARSLAPHHAGLQTDYATALMSSGAHHESLLLVGGARQLDGVNNDVAGWTAAACHFMTGQYRTALAAADQMKSANAAWRLRVVCHSELGEIEEARRIVAEGMKVTEPDFSLERWARFAPFTRREDIQHMIEGFRLAGVG